MIDKAGRQLIATRNGFGKTAQLTPDDAARIAQMHTNRQARAVLGVIAQILQRGYQITVPLYARIVSKDSRELQRTMTSRLDATNRWAQKVYAGIPDDDAPVNDLNRKKVTIALAQARDTVRDIDETAQDSGLMGALSNALDQALGAAWTRNVTPQTKRLAVKIGIGLAVVVGLIVVGKLVHSIMLGEGSALGRAEAMAMAIADAQRRKRHARSVLSVS